MIIDRRKLIRRKGLSLLAASAIVNYASIMPIKGVPIVHQKVLGELTNNSKKVLKIEDNPETRFFIKKFKEEMKIYISTKITENLICSVMNHISTHTRSVNWYPVAGMKRGIIEVFDQGSITISILKDQ